MKLIKIILAELLDFSADPPFSKKILNILLVIAFDIYWTFLMLMFLTTVIGFPLREIKVAIASNFTVSVIEQIFRHNLRLELFLACFLAPLWEESVFRYTAIRFAQFCDSLMGKSWMLLPIIFLSSILFGILHGSAINILFQGVSGLGFCWLFLKNRNSYWSVFAVHALWNLLVIFVI